MASTQQQFVKGKIYHVTGPSGKPSDMEHLGNFKLNGVKVLMFKWRLKLKHRAKPKGGQ